MKRMLMMVIIALSLIIIVSSGVLASKVSLQASFDIDPVALYDFENIYGSTFMQFTNFDTWHSIRPQQPELKVSYLTVSDISDFKVKYFLNDQTWGSYDSMTGASNTTLISGSYLFDFGLFIGFYSFDDIIRISPGYRFNLDKNSYVAVKADYKTNEDEGLEDYLVSAKYYNDKMYIRGKVLFPEETSDDTLYSFGLNYQVMDSLVAGVSYLSFRDDTTAYELGMTWGGDSDSKLIIDGKYGEDIMEDSYYSLSGVYKALDNLSVGAQYDKIETSDNAVISLKAKYVRGENQFGLRYSFENDDQDSTTIFLYQLPF